MLSILRRIVACDFFSEIFSVFFLLFLLFTLFVGTAHRTLVVGVCGARAHELVSSCLVLSITWIMLNSKLCLISNNLLLSVGVANVNEVSLRHRASSIIGASNCCDRKTYNNFLWRWTRRYGRLSFEELSTFLRRSYSITLRSVVLFVWKCEVTLTLGRFYMHVPVVFLTVARVCVNRGRFYG